MSPSKILIVRHGEKPDKDAGIHGVDVTGASDPHSLCVRGWQRAGALVNYFSGNGHAPRPDTLFAAAATKTDPSKRSLQTLTPLAAVLNKSICLDFEVGEEDRLAAEVLRHSGVVLVAWEHKAIHDIGNALVGNKHTVPQSWPGDRFDIVWEFVQLDDRYLFRSRGQLLLAGDRSD